MEAGDPNTSLEALDTRGVARVHEMTFEDGGRTIRGRWEISHDHETWEHDFDLDYRRA